MHEPTGKFASLPVQNRILMSQHTLQMDHRLSNSRWLHLQLISDTQNDDYGCFACYQLRSVARQAIEQASADPLESHLQRWHFCQGGCVPLTDVMSLIAAGLISSFKHPMTDDIDHELPAVHNDVTLMALCAGLQGQSLKRDKGCYCQESKGSSQFVNWQSQHFAEIALDTRSRTLR